MLSAELIALFIRLDSKQKIARFTLLGEVHFVDGTTDTVDLDEQKVIAKVPEIAALAALAPAKVNPTPAEIKPKPKAPAKAEGTPAKEVKEEAKPKSKSKGKSDYKPPVLIGLCRTLGTAEYLTNAGKWMEVAILKDTTVCSVRDGMANVAFTWEVKDESRLRNEQPIKAGQCQCEKCGTPKLKVA